MLTAPKLLEANPIDIPDLTASILQNVQLLPLSYQPTDVSVTAPYNPTAREVDPEVTSDVDEANISCQYFRSPEWWCDRLIDTSVVPWLWDLDISEVRVKQQEGYWDWELLVRQLSQFSIHKPDDTLLKISLSLRNRRRVWQILKEARKDDIAEVQMKRMTSSRERDRIERESKPVSLHFDYDEKGRVRWPPHFPPPGGLPPGLMPPELDAEGP